MAIDQTFPFSVAANALPVNVAPAPFNPIPGEGAIEIWAVNDVPTAAVLATLSVAIGGETNTLPVPTASIQGSPLGTVGAPPEAGNKIMDLQGVRAGVNLQVMLTGGSVLQTGRIRMRYRSTAELGAGVNAIAA
jgi:hypothetical protein